MFVGQVISRLIAILLMHMKTNNKKERNNQLLLKAGFAQQP
jgi:hypothetical protein